MPDYIYWPANLPTSAARRFDLDEYVYQQVYVSASSYILPRRQFPPNALSAAAAADQVWPRVVR